MSQCDVPFTTDQSRKRALNAGRPICLPAVLVTAAFHSPSVWACAACYGQSDSPMAAGMNWGILSLLGMIVLVLGGVAAFFVFLASRSAPLAAMNGELGISAKLDLDRPSQAHTVGTWQVAPLPACARVGPVSPLQRRRHRCAGSHSEPRRQAAPHSRS